MHTHTHTDTQKECVSLALGARKQLQDFGLRGYASMRLLSKSLVWLLSLCPARGSPTGRFSWRYIIVP